MPKYLIDYERYLKNKNLKYLTIKNYTSQIRNFYKQYNTIDKFGEYLYKMQIPLRKIAILRYLEMLEEQNIDVTEIKETVKNIKVHQNERKSVQTLEYNQSKLLDDMLMKKKKYQLSVIVHIIYDTGVRIRSILKLRKKDIEIANNGIYLLFREKRGKVIRRYITTSTYNLMKQYLKLNIKKQNDYLFFKEKRITGVELDEEYYKLWSELKNFSRKVFGTGVSFHWMRRGAGVYIYEKTDKDLIATSEFLGHENPDVTKKYLKIQAQKAEKVILEREKEEKTC